MQAQGCGLDVYTSLFTCLSTSPPAWAKGGAGEGEGLERRARARECSALRTPRASGGHGRKRGPADALPCLRAGPGGDGGYARAPAWSGKKKMLAARQQRRSRKMLHSRAEKGCNYTTSKRGNLAEHARTHTGERPFACEVEGCGYSATERSKLARHAKCKHRGVV